MLSHVLLAWPVSPWLCFLWLPLYEQAKDWSSGIQASGGGTHSSDSLDPLLDQVSFSRVGQEQKQRVPDSGFFSAFHSVSDPAQGGCVCPGTLLQPSFCLHREPYLWGEGGEIGVWWERVWG